MSYSIDVNILLYASDENGPHHEKARAFLESCAAGTEVLCLTWTTVMGYLRISTHPAVFDAPLSPEEARENIEGLLSCAHVRCIVEEEGFWDLYQEMTRDLAIRGNAVPDSHLATLLKQHGVRTLYTSDSDFRRYTFLEVRNPLLEQR